MACWEPVAKPDREWGLTPRWLELEQGGFLELDGCAVLALEYEEEEAE